MRRGDTFRMFPVIMAKLLLVVVVTVLSISAITDGDKCPPNCQETECTAMGCLSCDPGYCDYSDDITRKFRCVKKCPDGMYCQRRLNLCIQDK